MISFYEKLMMNIHYKCIGGKSTKQASDPLKFFMLSFNTSFPQKNAKQALRQRARMVDFLIQEIVLHVFVLVDMEEDFAMKGYEESTQKQKFFFVFALEQSQPILQPSGCGKILTASNSYQTLEDVVGERGGDIGKYGRDDYAMCNYWIQVYKILSIF